MIDTQEYHSPEGDRIMAPNAFKENSWRRLLDEIENGQIIPIIGPELLQVEIKGVVCPLYDWLAKELALRLDVKFEQKAQFDISDVIYRHRTLYGANCDLAQPYYEIYDILRSTQLNIPEALRTLASIKSLNLFITTTFDNLMEKALQDCRSQMTSLSFLKSGTIEDLPLQQNNPIVYHMFGKVNTLPTYVATEEDLLEFTQKWNERRPPRLSSILKDKDKYFMLLGCSYENWLTRFFLYGVKSESLFDPHARRGVIADNQSKNDEGLMFFLSRCNANLYTNGGATEFVHELGRRWKERNSDIVPLSPKTIIHKGEIEEFIQGSIFLSYASEDKELARQVRSALENEGVDVWFDEKKLESGDRYQETIAQNIRKSSFFIPLITPNTLTHERRFFRFEWSEAIYDMSFRPSDLPFVLPLISGTVEDSEPLIPKEFKQVHWTRICKDSDITEFASFCKQKIRNYRRFSK
jgi:hypothetical protein